MVSNIPSFEYLSSKKMKKNHSYPIIFQKRGVSGSFLRGKLQILPILEKRFCQIFNFERKCHRIQTAFERLSI